MIATQYNYEYVEKEECVCSCHKKTKEERAELLKGKK